MDDPWGYRRKVHFVFGPGRRSGPDRGRAPIVMGHYARGSRRIVPVRECPVHDARGNDVAFRLLTSYARALDSGATALKSIAIRAGARTRELMATLVVKNDADKRLRTATRRAIAGSGVTAFHLNLHPDDDPFIFGKRTRRIEGTERLREEVAGAAFLLSPTAFFQTNVQAAEVLVRLVLDAAGGLAPADVLDLYAGSGLFALPLALAGHRVTAVEENREAVEDGEASVRLNRIPGDRCRFIARRVEAALPAVAEADVAVLDPPRDGCSAFVLDDLFGRVRPRRAVYVSCNPAALGRDLQAIASHGYRIDSVQPVDMFPHTAHIETVVEAGLGARGSGLGTRDSGLGIRDSVGS